MIKISIYGKNFLDCKLVRYMSDDIATQGLSNSGFIMPEEITPSLLVNGITQFLLSGDSISFCCSKDPENADSRLESLVMGTSFTSGSVIEVEYIA